MLGPSFASPHRYLLLVPSEDRLVTVPNVISLARLACVPVFLWLLFGRDDRAAAALLLAALGATDWVDGYIARHFNQVSTVGKVLDPTADRVLLAVAVVALLVDGSVPPVVAWLVLVREVLDDLAAQSEYDIPHDPLYTIKAHETGAPADLSQHADHYLYGARKP